jgi:hypothetical protein
MFTLRKHGSTRTGGPFPLSVIEAVWRKATAVWGVNPAIRRKDSCGAWIDRANYGDTTANGTGWEIDHVLPVSKGGSDDVSNLQPLQWQNNRAKSDGPLACIVSAA